MTLPLLNGNRKGEMFTFFLYVVRLAGSSYRPVVVTDPYTQAFRTSPRGFSRTFVSQYFIAVRGAWRNPFELQGVSQQVSIVSCYRFFFSSHANLWLLHHFKDLTSHKYHVATFVYRHFLLVTGTTWEDDSYCGWLIYLNDFKLLCAWVRIGIL